MKPKYRIYPSLLDKFQKFIDYEAVADEFWNRDAGGDYKLTPDEMADRLEQELLDAVNRVEHAPSEAADRGTCFNEIVDCLIENRGCMRADMDIRSIADSSGRKATIEAKMDGFTFMFDTAMCRQAAAYFRGSLPQQYVEAVLPTAYGDVLLYGFMDEWVGDKIYDIKTTGSYSFGKFERCWQKLVYPYCVIESGQAEKVSEFEYSVWQLNKSAIIGGSFYRETYAYDHCEARRELRDVCERFIEWLRLKDAAGLVTHRRIFNEDADGHELYYSDKARRV